MPHPVESRSALFPRSFAKSYPRAVRGEGVYLWDSEGKRYLDISGSAAVNFIGHGDQEIIAAMAAQGRELEFVHSSQFSTPVAEVFARELIDFAGENFSGGCVFFTCGGSEAVETALKLARQYQVEAGHSQRHRVISQRQSYHGATLGALAVSGNPRRRDLYAPMFADALSRDQVSIPYCYRCPYGCQDCARQYADELMRSISADTAAFIFEPVSGATLGAAVPPDGYLQHIAEVCRKSDVLLIADEVMTGCGRTGTNFAVEHWKVAPDILALGKGIASGYAPLGAVIANRKVVDALASGSGSFVHGFTYNAHPVAVAAGQAALRRILSAKLVERAHSNLPGKTLASLRACRNVGDVRGIGLLWGVEFVEDKKSKRPFAPKFNFAGRVAAEAARRGLLLYPIQGCADGYAGDHVLIAPPAVITENEIVWAVEQLKAAIEVAAQ